MYDFIIVGGGVAGCSAAVTARMRNLNTIMVYNGDGAMEKAHRIDNYPGMPQIGGKELLNKMREHAVQMGAQTKQGLVQKILPMDGTFSVLVNNDLLEGKAVLLACGTSRVQTLENEEDLLGMGVSYCATCDGNFYKDKDILVVAASHEAVEEANFLAELGRVQYITEKKHDTNGLHPGITMQSGKPKSIRREDGRMVLTTDAGDYTGDGVFVLRPAVAMTQLLPEVQVEKGFVKVNKDMGTNIPGVFSAGDMAGSPLQVAKAAGEGNIAALSAASYIKSLPADKTV